MADLLVHAAKIWTLDPARPQVEAIGLRDGLICAVGTVSEVRSALSRAGELDLGGATVVPGLVDAHGHLLMLGRQATQVDLSGAQSSGEIARRVLERAGRTPWYRWIRGYGWDQNLFPSKAFPDRSELDRLVPGHPVLLERVDGHAALVNGRALEIAGIGSGRGDPPGGRIVRDAGGSPTGMLLDSALELVAGFMPLPAPAELEAALQEGMRRCARVGLVGIHDAGTDRDGFDALKRLEDRHALTVRVYAMARWGEPRFAETLAAGPVVGERLSLRAVKFFLDGALGSRGAALFEDYADLPGERGLLTGPEPLGDVLTRVMARGFQPACHAIGDRANALALDAIEAARQRTGRVDLRPRIEHAQVLRPVDLPRFAKLGVIASVQPTHAVSDLNWAESRLGARVAGAYLWKSLASAGALLALGSDFPIEPPDPLRGIWAACGRGGWHVEERLDRAAALLGFTRGACYAAFEEALGGRLSVGRRADLSAFDQDPLTCPAEALLEARAVSTVVAGEVTFGA